MTTKETEQKAQFIYNKLLNNQPEKLNDLLYSLSPEYSDDEILNLDDWVESYRENGNLFVLIKLAQQSKGLDIDDEYVRTSIYYCGVKSDNDVINLVDEDEAVEWITSALNEYPDIIANLDIDM